MLLCGIEGHICVTQTCLQLLKREHEVHVIRDATSSQRSADLEVGLARMEKAGAIISSTVRQGKENLSSRADGRLGNGPLRADAVCRHGRRVRVSHCEQALGSAMKQASSSERSITEGHGGGKTGR